MVHEEPAAEQAAVAASALEALAGASRALRAAGLWVFVGLGPDPPAARERPPKARRDTTAPRPAVRVPIARALRELVVAVRVTDPQESRSDDAIIAEARDFLTGKGGATAESARALRDQVLAEWRGPGSAYLSMATLIERIEDAASTPAALESFLNLVAAARKAKATRPALAVLCHLRALDLQLARSAHRKKLGDTKIDWRSSKLNV